MENKRIMFMGTTSFAAHILEQLIINNYQVIALVSQPDRAVGRKREIKYTKTKEIALKYDIDVLSYENINEHYDEIKQLNPDLIITCAYGQKISKDILDIPLLKSINVHASLLPKYRGAAPIHYAIIKGEEITGNTIMYMEEALDTGNMIVKSEVVIDEKDTYDSLADKLMIDAANLLLDNIDSILNKENDSIKQDDSKATYAPIIKRSDEFIDFNRDVKEVYNNIRGLISIPGCYAYVNNKKIKFYDVYYANKDSEVNKVTCFKEHFEIGCLNGVIIVKEFQLEGKKRVLFKQYRNGNNLDIEDGIFINEGVEDENRSK